MNRKKKIYLKYILCNIINVFTVTFNQFNASLLNKSINFFKKNLSTLTKAINNYLSYF